MQSPLKATYLGLSPYSSEVQVLAYAKQYYEIDIVELTSEKKEKALNGSLRH